MKALNYWPGVAMVVLAVIFISSARAVSRDSDSDGMPDGWEISFGSNIGNQADALDDKDQDGFANFTEYLLGTDPQDSGSHPTLADNREKIIAYWPLATNAIEVLGADLAGKSRNGASFSGSAVKLDGRDDYVNFGSSSVLSVTGSVSYCLWLKPDAGNRTGRILGKFKTSGNNREYSVFSGPGDRLWLFFSDNGSLLEGHSIVKATGRHAVKDGQWQHLAVTWDAAGGSAGVVCRIDAGNVPLCDLVSSEIKSLHSGPADLTLGAYDISIAGSGRWQKEVVLNSFKGSMAQLVLCKGVLSDLEIREIYFLGRKGDLKQWLDMDFDQDVMPDWWERKYMVDISQPAEGDVDEDGLTNIAEYRCGTDPVNPDSDGDGLPDGWEVIHNLNPRDVADALRDTDSDGLSNVQEYRTGSDPDNPDSDGDGFLDGADPDPLNPSAKEPDILPDDWELLWFGNLNRDGAGDFDRDSVADVDEYAAGTDPIRANVADVRNDMKFEIFFPGR